MTRRPQRQEDGKYHIDGRTFPNLFGSRKMVWSGTAFKTEGGLMKKDLYYTKNNRIVSKKKHFTAKKERRLEKAGFFTQRGKFGYVRKTQSRKTKRGGDSSAPSSPPVSSTSAPVSSEVATALSTGGKRRKTEKR